MTNYGAAESSRDVGASLLSAEELRSNFWHMSLCFSFNHATATAPLILSSSLLRELAYVGNGVFYSSALVASLLLAVPIVSNLGPKCGLLAGMWLYGVYICGFAIAMMLPWDFARWVLWLVASACGGLGGGILWTSQGRYFASSATQLARASGESQQAVSAALAGNFSTVYLLLEVFMKLSFSALQELQWASHRVAFLYGGVALVSAALMCRAHDLGGQGELKQLSNQVLGVVSLWSDPVVWLLSLTNLTFGFCAAYMNGYVNGEITSKTVGVNSVGLLSAFTCVVAAGFSSLTGHLGGRVGKGWFIVAAAICFFSIPCILTLDCCENWYWGLAVLYALQGVGRAVYESANRVTFAEFFAGDQVENAFANCALQSNIAFSLSFFLQEFWTKEHLQMLVMGLAGLTPMCFTAAAALRGRNSEEWHLKCPPEDEPRDTGEGADARLIR